MDMLGIGIAIGIGIETEWLTSKSIPIPKTPQLSTASTIHKSERNSDSWPNMNPVTCGSHGTSRHPYPFCR